MKRTKAGEEGRGSVEPGREELEGLMRRNGLTETEAVAAYHLGRALDAFKEVYPVDENAIDAGLFTELRNDMHFGLHFDALYKILGIRVLHRDYPEGWGAAARPEE